ncbi:unnamed protein product, partial [Closterium sp. NIES-53]
GHERYFLLVVDDYLRYTTVFPLCSKDGGCEFSCDLLRAFCRAEGIRQTFTLPASPQPNGIAERRIGMFSTLRIKSIQPRVSLPETTPTLRWTGKVGDASVFRVWGSRAFVRDNSADKLSSRAVPCVFLGFPLDAPGWQFYHPTSRHVVSSQDVTFDESVSYYRRFPYRTASLPPPPLFLAPDLAEPVEVAVDSGAARGVEPKRVEPGGAEPGGAESGSAEPGGAEPEHAASGGPSSVSSRREPRSPQQLRDWYARRCQGAAGAAGAAGAGGAAGAAGGAAGPGAAGGAFGAAQGATSAGVPGGATARRRRRGRVAARVAAAGAAAASRAWRRRRGREGELRGRRLACNNSIGSSRDNIGSIETTSAAAETTSVAAKTTSAAAETTPAAAETTSAATETTLAAAETTPAPIAGPSTAPVFVDNTPQNPAQQLNPTPREVHRSANFTAGFFYSNSDMYRQSRALGDPRAAPIPSPAVAPSGGPRAARPAARELPLQPANRPCSPRTAPAASCPRASAGWRVWGWRVYVSSLAPPPPPSPTTAAAAEEGGCVGAVGVALGGCRGVAAVKPAAPVARETVAPVAREPVAPVVREPVAPVAREPIAPAARLAAEPVAPVARVPVALVASVPVAPVARVPVAPAAPCASSFSCRPQRPLLS